MHLSIAERMPETATTKAASGCRHQNYVHPYVDDVGSLF